MSSTAMGMVSRFVRGPRGALALAFAAALSGCNAPQLLSDVDAGDGGALPQPWLNIDPTWSSIYDGYFGPAGVASCTSTAAGSSCHTSADQNGAIASNLVCADKDGCFASLTGMSNLIRTQDIAAPASTPFLAKLRQPGGTGRMPNNTMFTFQPEDIDVLKTWISMGAKDD